MKKVIFLIIKSLISFVFICITYLKKVASNQVMVMAGYLTYTTLLSLVPLLVVILAVFSYIPWVHVEGSQILDSISDINLPAEVTQTINKYMEEFISNSLRSGTFGLISFFFITLFTLNGIEKIVNNFWENKKKSSLLSRLIKYLLLIIVTPTILFVSFAIQAILKSFKAFELFSNYVDSLYIFGIIFSFLTQMFVIMLIIKVLPRAYVPLKHAFTGALFAEILLQISQSIFMMYLQITPVYANIYGTLAVIPILMLEVYISWICFLCGAQLAEILHHLPTYKKKIENEIFKNKRFVALAIKLNVSDK